MRHRPGRPGGEDALSYGGLRDRVAALAGGMRTAGLQPGERVALLLHNGLAYVEAYLAAVAAGLAVVPLNVRLVREDYLHMLADSGSRMLVTAGEFLRRVPELLEVDGLEVVDVDRDGLAALAARGVPLAAPVDCAAEAPASLMYTSGTTGARRRWCSPTARGNGSRAAPRRCWASGRTR
ncbi:hypothetical protein BJF78_23810 [Pseudonocardia sp. CNS-139]|nr:hypothetical protein BJF78_23810 [Pseudonocardia sp. CNS-139]